MKEDKNIAIVGISGTFPQASNMEEFYKNLTEGRDSVREISYARLQDCGLDTKSNYQVRGFLERIDEFDYHFFKLSKKEAEVMDPSQRLLLELSCEAIESSGMKIDDLNGSNTAVYIGGNPYTDYHKLNEEEDHPTLLTGNLHAVLAGRISYLLNLNGPSIVIDTACSSSLVAVHKACQELILREVDCALAGGVNIILDFPKREAGNEIGILSKGGKSRTFDANADGAGAGEGGAVVLLKRLEDAISDGDIIHGVILGSAVNSDGALSNGLTSPSPKAQAEVIQKAWKNANVNPETIGYIEAHGTGTELGDPIEFQGISDAFRAHTDKRHFCGIGSLKTNLGHLNNAAGIAGLVKGVMSLKKKVLFPSLHFEKPNPYIDFDNTAAYVNTEFRSWKSDDFPRRCGVSSFGLSGTNVHMIIEEAPEHNYLQQKTTAPEKLMLKISARDYEVFNQYLNSTLTLIQESDNQLEETLYSLNVGRGDYQYRLCLHGKDKNDIVTQLQQAIDENLHHLLETDDKKRGVILLFSDELPPKSKVKSLELAFPIFKATRSKLLKIKSEKSIRKKLETFAFQYSLYKLLESYSVSVDLIIGTGTGKLIHQIVSGNYQLENIAEYLKNKELYKPLNEAKLVKSVSQLISSGHTYFLEMGSQGILSEKLRILKKSIGDFEVFKLLDSNSHISPCLSNLYHAGIFFDWNTYYDYSNYRKVEVPTYPFKRERCWIDGSEHPQGPAVHEWFYRTKWINEELENQEDYVKGGHYLVFMDDEGLGDKLVKRLNKIGNDCIKVSKGERFRKVSENHFEINVLDESTCVALEKEIASEKLKGIINLIDCDSSVPITHDIVDQRLSEGLYTHFYIAKVFNDCLEREGFQLMQVSNNAQQVFEEEITPDRHMTVAFYKSLLSSYLTLDVRCLDISLYEESYIDLTEYILAELSNESFKNFVSYRSGKRYIEQIEEIYEYKPKGQVPIYQEGGVYVITGGINGIGYEVSKSITSAVDCTLLIIGRTVLPPKSSWSEVLSSEHTSHEVKERVEALQMLQESGSNVTYYSTHVADKVGMKEVFDIIKSKFQKIDGIIHIAGVTGDWVTLPELSLKSLMDTLAPKVHGSLLLYEMSLSLTPSFFVMFSSLNTIVPQKNSYAYAVANAFEDALALYLSSQMTGVKAINWGSWLETGMGLKMNEDASKLAESPIKGWKTVDGIRALNLTFDVNAPNVLVGDFDLDSFKNNPFFNIKESIKMQPVVDVSIDHIPAVDASDMTLSERGMFEVWCTVLGSSAIALDDNFFKLGGHSLLATRVITRSKKLFGVNLKFRDLVANPTLRGISKYIDQQRNNEQSGAYEQIEAVEPKSHYALSHAQKRLWIRDQFEESRAAYNITGAYTFHGSLNIEAFEKSFISLIDRHESLRTVFKVINEVPCQQIVPSEESKFKFHYQDFSNEKDPEAKCAQFRAEEFKKPFDIRQWPLLRANILKISDDRFMFILILHHIISDGWSMNVLINHVLSFYVEYLEGKEVKLDPLRIQYKDYSEWELNQLQGEEAEHHRNYWLDNLSGRLPLSNIPTDYQRPAIKTDNGARANLMIDRATTDALKKLGDTYDMSLFMVLLSTVNLLLHKYTRQEDIIVGTPVAGREHLDLEDQIGFYINMLPLRTEIAGNMTFNQLLERVKQVALNSYEHQSYPFDKLLEDMDLDRDMSRSPIFDIVVVMQNSQVLNSATEFKDITLEAYCSDDTISKYDLLFNFTETLKGIEFYIEYNTDLFKKSRIEKMSLYYQQLLKALLQNPNSTISDLAILNDKEESAELSWIPSRYPDDKSLVDIFITQAEKFPDTIAVKYGETALTYRELNERSNQLANCLIEQYNVVPRDHIGLLMERTELVLIALWGILKAGAVYVPVDPTYPNERINYTLSDAGVKVLVTDEFSLSEVMLLGFNAFALTQKGEELSAYDESNLEIAIQPEDLAYIIYTSGSTGTPKGVMVEHKNVIQLFVNDELELDFHENHVWTLFFSAVFDFSVSEIFGAHLFGAKLIVVPRAVTRSPKDFVDLLEKEKVTVLNLVSGYFKKVITEVQRRDTIDLSLQYIIFGAETSNLKILKEFHSSYPDIQLVHIYGITETTVFVTLKTIGKAEIASGENNIGKEYPTYKVYIMDDYQRLMPDGTIGEIVVSGPGVTRGYINQKQLTSDRFIDNPYKVGERLYLSGDLGMRMENRDIIYKGRKDHQVKIRGYRIELGDIEHALMGHKNIKEAIVLVEKDQQDYDQLISYLVLIDPNAELELRSYLEATLPGYMIPAQFIVLKEFPVTITGKVDRDKLKDVEGVVLGSMNTYVVPNTDEEKELAEIWQEVLGIVQVGLEDDFFALGGDSIKAITLVVTINERMDLEVDMEDIFMSPTIAQLLHKGQGKEDKGDILSREDSEKALGQWQQKIINDPEQHKMLPRGWIDFYPLSDIQKGMVFHSLMDPEMYYDQLFFELEDDKFNLNLFKKTIHLLVESHDSLKSSYNMEDFMEPIQIVNNLDMIKIDLELEKLTHLSTDQQKQYLQDYLKNDRERGFDLKKPLWRMRLFQLTEKTYSVLLVIHHAMIDGWSNAFFTREVHHVYNNLKQNKDFTLIKPKVKFKDYIIDQLRYKDSGTVRTYWSEYLMGYERTPLPFAPSISATDKEKEASGVLVDHELREKVSDLAKQIGLGVKHIYLAAFVYLLKLTTGSDDITTGVLSHGRPELEDADKLIGCFLNTIPFRIDFTEEEFSGIDLLNKVKEDIVKQKGNDKLSLYEISKCVEDTKSDNPIFDNFFAYLDFHVYENEVKEGKLKIGTITSGFTSTNNLFELQVIKHNEELYLYCTRLKSIYTDNEINRMMIYYISILKFLTEKSEMKLDAHQILAQSEQEELIGNR